MAELLPLPVNFFSIGGGPLADGLPVPVVCGDTCKYDLSLYQIMRNESK